ncbi:MAG: CDP-alcohol phosphatidyltransferase family protein [Dehalococcoidia bacterium]|nr:CDP-alcohol phosphatidyltransferase family protein [Dehalococcoidia bacterium]
MALRARARLLLAQYFEKPSARLLHAARLTPNTVTLLGLALTGVAAYLAAQGHFIIAGVVFLVASALDMLDGALARLTNQATRFGAALDSVADRLGEASILIGIAWFYLRTDNDAGVILAFGATVASYMVSYLRARGEGLGIAMKETGLGTRTERVLIMAAGLLTGLVIAAMALVLALAAFTSGQRLYHLWRQGREK